MTYEMIKALFEAFYLLNSVNDPGVTIIAWAFAVVFGVMITSAYEHATRKI